MTARCQAHEAKLHEVGTELPLFPVGICSCKGVPLTGRRAVFPSTGGLPGLWCVPQLERAVSSAARPFYHPIQLILVIDTLRSRCHPVAHSANRGMTRLWPMLSLIMQIANCLSSFTQYRMSLKSTGPPAAGYSISSNVAHHSLNDRIAPWLTKAKVPHDSSHTGLLAMLHHLYRTGKPENQKVEDHLQEMLRNPAGSPVPVVR